MENVFAAAIPHLRVPPPLPDPWRPASLRAAMGERVAGTPPPPPSIGQLGSEAADLHDGLGSEAVESGILQKRRAWLLFTFMVFLIGRL